MYENYFTPNVALENHLQQKNKMDLYDTLKQIIPEGVKFSFAKQSELKGNGLAVLCAKEIIGNRDFVVMWVDDIYINKDKDIISQLVDVYEQEGGIVENIIEFPREEITRYAALTNVSIDGNIVRAKGLIEKPKQDEIDSNFASMGPYILSNKVLELLPLVSKGNNGEINLTDAINLAMQSGTKFSGILCDAERYDCGTNLELAKSNIRLSIKENKILYEEAKKCIEAMNDVV